MASYLQIENISKSYGPKILFEHIGFNVNEGDKIALIAPNGTGKTSLLRIIAGKDSSDSGGRVMFLKDIRIAFLEQDYDWSPDSSILDQVLSHSSRDTAAFHEDEKAAFVQRLKELLTSFRLPDFSMKMSALSGAAGLLDEDERIVGRRGQESGHQRDARAERRLPDHGRAHQPS